jgi:multidrug transporter EmrE-like cation transporter
VVLGVLLTRNDFQSAFHAGKSRNLMSWLYLGIAILAEVIGTTALKASDGFAKLIPSLVVVVAYGASFYFLSLTLKVIPVGIAYAIWSGVGIVLIVLAGWWFFGQTIDKAGIVGILLIGAGVFVLNTLSQTGVH